MKKIVIAFILLNTYLFADSKPSCYSVQLMSLANTLENETTLKKKAFPQDCLVMKISDQLKVRCGCYKTKDLAKKSMLTLEKKYKKRYITSTYAYRFNALKKQEKKVEKKLLTTHKKKRVKKEVSDISVRGEICYSVRLLTKYNTEKNYKFLENKTYPSSCALYKIGQIASVRCGCFNDFSIAKANVVNFKNEYKEASVVSMSKKIYVN